METTLPLDLGQDIIKYIPYHNQGTFRRACKKFNSFPLTKQTLSELPTSREIVHYLFARKHGLDIDNLIHYKFHRRTRVKGVYVAWSSGICSIYHIKYKSGNRMMKYIFKLEKHLNSYLSGYDLNFSRMSLLNWNCFPINLCKNILRNRVKHDPKQNVCELFELIIGKLCHDGVNNNSDFRITLSKSYGGKCFDCDQKYETCPAVIGNEVRLKSIC